MRRNDNVIRDNHAESDNIKADEIRDNHTESGNIIENNIKNNRNIKYLAGTEKIKVQPLASFDADVCEFLDVLSKEILKDINLKTYTDVVAFAFWIRKGNLQKQKESYMARNGSFCRIGKGLAFHIAPSNVPINFAYSFVFGLLAGNSNIVRVSSKNFPQVTLLCRKIQEVMSREEYAFIRESNAIVMYERQKEITDAFSSMCDVRVIWGGDNTIQEIRKSPLKPRGKEIVFADRYSFGIICPDAILSMSDKEQKQLAAQFYNDTYLMDQNACSAPHIIFWKSKEKEKVRKAQEIFWGNVYEAAKKYDLADSKVSDKYTDLCLYAAGADGSMREEDTKRKAEETIEAKEDTEWKTEEAIGAKLEKSIKEKAKQDIETKPKECIEVELENDIETKSNQSKEIREIKAAKVRRYENLLYVVELGNVPKTITDLRGRFGMFYECQIKELEEIKNCITEKVQTVATAGVEKQEIWDFVMEHHLMGIDRVVPFGSTLDIGLIWDGYDLIMDMSRVLN